MGCLRPRTTRDQPRERGQGLLEYSLVIALVAVLVVAVLVVVGKRTAQTFCGASNGLSGSSVGGSMVEWGYNGYGQLGNGTSTNQFVPAVLNGYCFSAVSTGGFHSLALDQSGNVWSWGLNNGGQLGQPSVAVDSLPHSTPGLVPGLANITMVVAAFNFNVALRNDGSVWEWGDNSYSKMGDGSGSANQVTPSAVCAVGSSSACGSNSNNYLKNIVNVVAGGNQVLAVDRSGAVYAWGEGQYGEMGNATTTASNPYPVVVTFTNPKFIAVGHYSDFAIDQGGQLWAWGDDSAGQLGIPSRCTSPTPCTQDTSPTQVPAMSSVSQVSTGEGETLALTTAGAVYGWGYNASGQVGDNLVNSAGYANQQNTPTPLGAPLTSGVKQVVGSMDGAAAALKTDGSVWSWGSGGHQGNGTGTQQNMPAAVCGIGAAGSSACAGTLTGIAFIQGGMVGSFMLAYANHPV